MVLPIVFPFGCAAHCGVNGADRPYLLMSPVDVIE
jgi:hypothetical protein